MDFCVDFCVGCVGEDLFYVGGCKRFKFIFQRFVRFTCGTGVNYTLSQYGFSCFLVSLSNFRYAFN